MSDAERLALLLEQDLVANGGNIVLALASLLHDGVITVPRVSRRRHEVATPDVVGRDLRDIEAIVAGLGAMYAAAYAELEPGGLGEGGSSQIWDSNPTERQAMDPAMAERRAHLRELADLVKVARDSLHTVRHDHRVGLVAMLEPNAGRQAGRVGKVKTTISQEDLAASLEARARNRGWEG